MWQRHPAALLQCSCLGHFPPGAVMCFCLLSAFPQILQRSCQIRKIAHCTCNVVECHCLS